MAEPLAAALFKRDRLCGGDMIVIGVAGGSGSGKSTFAGLLAKELESRARTNEFNSRGLSSAGVAYGQVLILEQDCYYRDQSAKFDHDGGCVNFDHPSAIEWPLLVLHLQKLRQGCPIERPVYDFATHKRLSEVVVVNPVRFLILDGILI